MAAFAYGRSMRSLMSCLLGVVMCLALGLGTIAHAAEVSTPVVVCVADGVHQDTQGDADKDIDQSGLHAHGGCHGHHQVGEADRGDHAARLLTGAVNFAVTAGFMPQGLADATLRPPIA